MRGVIYCYTLSGKKYVGKTLTEERKRIDKHKFDALTKKANTPFARAIRKYGWENARKSYEVLEEVFADTKESLQSILCQKEEEWIEKMGSLVPNGYNVYKKGQDHLLCAKNKEEMYRKISVSLKGKYMNQEATSRKIYCVEQDKWYPSSKICHHCGYIKKDLKLSDRIYKCDCGYIEDRDFNASLNLRDAETYKIA